MVATGLLTDHDRFDSSQGLTTKNEIGVRGVITLTLGGRGTSGNFIFMPMTTSGGEAGQLAHIVLPYFGQGRGPDWAFGSSDG